MLNEPQQSGFTLVELLVAIVIAGMLFSLGIPSFREWIQNSQIRNGTEAIMNGFQLARAEAVRRNTNVQIVLTASTSPSGFDWKVQCVTATSGVQGDCPGGSGSIQAFSSTEGARNAQVDLGANVAFNGLGRVVSSVPAVSSLATGKFKFNVSSSAPGMSCIEQGGKVRCLRVEVTPGGQIRMCDPSVSWSVTSPQGC